MPTVKHDANKKRARKKGRGCVRERRPGVWQVITTKGRDPITGKVMQYRQTVHGTREDAEKRLTKMLTALDDGKAVKRAVVTIETWLGTWMADFVECRVRLNTVRAYRNCIDAWIVPHLGKKQIQKVTRADVNAWLLRLTKDGLGSSSVRLACSVLNGALDIAVDSNLISANPAAKPKGRPKMVRRRPGEVCTLTPAEVVAYIAAAKAHGTLMHAFVTLALATGARQSELLGLRWSDIDIATCTISIDRQLLRPNFKRDDGTYTDAVYGPPKSGGLREVEVDPHTILILERHLAAQRILKVKHGPKRYHDSDLVFGREESHLTERQDDTLGFPIAQDIMRTAFRRMAKAGGLRVVVLHTTRHTYITEALASGMPAADVARRVGDTVETILSTYAHAVKAHEAPGIAAVGRMLHGGQ